MCNILVIIDNAQAIYIVYAVFYAISVVSRKAVDTRHQIEERNCCEASCNSLAWTTG